MQVAVTNRLDGVARIERASPSTYREDPCIGAARERSPALSMPPIDPR
jgi:hypothetical protein